MLRLSTQTALAGSRGRTALVARLATAGFGLSAAACLCMGPALADGIGPTPAQPSFVNQSIVAQASPAPNATARPKAFTYSGYLRSYDFSRLNNPQISPKNPLNQTTWSTGVSLHGAYDFGGGFSAAATYFYANPFAGGCNSASTHGGPPCNFKPNDQVPGQRTNPADTIPGFEMSTLYEAYVQFKNDQFFARVGNQVINTPWANPADTRLKPIASRGADASYAVDKHWSVE